MGLSEGSSLLPIANFPPGSATISGSMIGDGCAGEVMATCGVAGAVADEDLVSGLVSGTVCGTATEVDLVELGVCAGACSDRAAKCFGCHTKKYHVAVAAAALAITLTLTTTATASPGMGLALMTAAGSGSTR